MRRYLIYWDSKDSNTDGNIIVLFDPKREMLVELIQRMINDMNKKDPKLKIQNLVIKFMVELK